VLGDRRRLPVAYLLPDPTERTSEGGDCANFSERRYYELRRIHLPRRWVNSIEMRCRMGPRMGGAAFAVFVGFLLDALVGHGEVGLPGHAVVVGHLPG
jgi:hypothetical protein